MKYTVPVAYAVMGSRVISANDRTNTTTSKAATPLFAMILIFIAVFLSFYDFDMKTFAVATKK